MFKDYFSITFEKTEDGRLLLRSLPLLLVDYEPVTGSHVGPGAFGVAYISA